MRKIIACIHPDTFELLKHGRYEDTKHVTVHRRSELCETIGHVALYDDVDARIDELTAALVEAVEFIESLDKDSLQEEGKFIGSDVIVIARNALKEG